jgi:hypothetical protein
MKNLGLAPHLLVLALISAGLAACGNAKTTARKEDPGPVAECDAFVASYEHCLESLGPASIARERAVATRATLLAQAAQGDGAREALRQKCADSLSRLTKTCR